MAVVGIFFGSDTGNTEAIAKQIQKKLGAKNADLYDIAKASRADIEKYNFLLLGIPTWYYGESQCDWDDFFPELQKVDFADRIVGIFGCGDQEDYAEYFLDAMGTLRDLIEPRGATSLATGQLPATSLKHRRRWSTTTPSLALALMKIVSPN